MGSKVLGASTGVCVRAKTSADRVCGELFSDMTPVHGGTDMRSPITRPSRGAASYMVVYLIL